MSLARSYPFDVQFHYCKINYLASLIYLSEYLFMLGRLCFVPEYLSGTVHSANLNHENVTKAIRAFFTRQKVCPLVFELQMRIQTSIKEIFSWIFPLAELLFCFSYFFTTSLFILINKQQDKQGLENLIFRDAKFLHKKLFHRGISFLQLFCAFI